MIECHYIERAAHFGGSVKCFKYKKIRGKTKKLIIKKLG